jgi:hypothetical protein
MFTALAFVALACTALFAGAALYINLVEHPARLECGTELAATEFGPSYRMATAMQGTLAVVGALAGLGAWWMTRDPLRLWAALMLGAVVPFTLIVILPTNKALLDPALDRASAGARDLLVRWGRLHAVRTALSLVALVLLLIR